jgi:hypothetical protein
MTGGSIYKNTAKVSGGGVYVSAGSGAQITTFNKSGGFIAGYADEDPNSNKVDDGTKTDKGSAVFCGGDGKHKEGNAGSSLALYAKCNSGIWTYIYNGNDTSPNWEEPASE